MTVDFVNSEEVKLDDKSMIFSREPFAILREIEKTIEKIGPGKFYSSPEDEIKKVRESMAAFFFMVTLQKDRPDRLVMLMQPQNDPPDFIITTIGNEITEMTMDPVELVEIPPRVEFVDDMLSIVKKKIKKGYSQSYHLLIYINNTRSQEWIPTLDAWLKDYKPFSSIYTIHLLENKIDWWPVVHKLRPGKIRKFETKLSEVKFPTTIPNCMMEMSQDSHKFLIFKPESIAKIREKVKNIKNSSST